MIREASMNAEQLRSALSRVVADRRLLDHPFYLRWSAGELSRDELRAYAAQYRHVEAALPGILRSIAGGADDQAHGAVMRTLADEVGGAGVPSHLELFDQFAAALGAPATPASAATERLVDVLSRLAETSTAAGLAGLSAYELQSPEVSATKAAGLRQWYGLAGDAVAFWDAHATADVEHAEWLIGALAGVDSSMESATEAAGAAADAWWAFLDERETSRC
jgi:pyrroloquinoline-quinone synthase